MGCLVDSVVDPPGERWRIFNDEGSLGWITDDERTELNLTPGSTSMKKEDETVRGRGKKGEKEGRRRRMKERKGRRTRQTDVNNEEQEE